MTVSYQEGSGEGAQGVQLSWRLWTAPEPSSTLLLVHGLGEHSGRYDSFARILAEGGTTVFSFDLRGHGRSEGPRGDVDAFPRLLEDLLSMEAEMTRHAPPRLPRFLMGHSLGGLICIRRLQVFRGPYSGAIFSAPWLATAAPDWIRGFGRFLGVALPTVRLPAGINPERLSRDQEMVAAWREDPLIHTKISGRFFREAEREQNKALSTRLPDGMPALFLVPEEDRVVRSPVTLAFARGIVGGEAQVEILRGGRHEPLNDVDRDDVYQIVIDWLAERVHPGERNPGG